MAADIVFASLMVMCLLPMGRSLGSQSFDLHMNDEDLFERFELEFERSYESAQHRSHRFATFQENLKKARFQNEQERGIVTFGVNKFSDMSETEFHQQVLASIVSTSPEGSDSFLGVGPCTDNVLASCYLSNPIPDSTSFDWRDDSRGIVTAVRNQGLCGACWAFSSAEAIEGAWLLANNSAAASGGQVSVQEILSCAPSLGCIGGDIQQALVWALNSSGIAYDDADPYACVKGCPSTPSCPTLSGPVVKIKAVCGCSFPTNETAMMHLLVAHGPLSVNVDADPWQSYSGGIIQHNCASSPSDSDHAVQVVAFGTDTSNGFPIDYWTIKNSWGSDWGENGYVRVVRGKNMCGLANNVYFAISPSP